MQPGDLVKPIRYRYTSYMPKKPELSITRPQSRLRKRYVFALVLIPLIAICISLGVLYWPKIAHKLHSLRVAGSVDPSRGEATFPQIDTTTLHPTRQKIISLTKTEFEAQSAGTKFSQGAREAWCADFVSWIMQQANAPLKNPHTGGWRIPGTFTLREYYEAAGRFKPIDSGYQPRPGDVAIYRGSPVFGDHTNIVLKNNDGVLTTVGGNEMNRIRVFTNHDKRYDGLLGYGVLAE